MQAWSAGLRFPDISCVCALAALQVPHDRPVVSQRMIETWIESAEQGLDEFSVQAGRRDEQAAAQSGLSVS